MSRLSHLVTLSPETHSGFKRGETPIRQFQVHRASAKERGIEFKLTFEQWDQWWKDSGHYHERGKERGQYVMSRKGDLGAYELGNIECKLSADNIAEAHTGKLKSEEWKNKVRATKTRKESAK
jgi:hypothetical protein